MLKHKNLRKQGVKRKTYKINMVLLVLYSILSGCYPQNNQIITPQESYRYAIIEKELDSIMVDSNSTLKAISTFPIGVATGSWLQRKSPKGFKQLEDQFNSKTVYAYMNIEATQGKYNFGESDYWVKWAETHPVRLHGHCLVYHQEAPTWLLNFKGSTIDFEKIIKAHIQTIVSRYKGRIKSWDVINESFSFTSGGVAGTPFRRLYPNDEEYIEFIKRCFQWAHESDPEAFLFYNDGGIENNKTKLKNIINFVKSLKASGTPIHGIGTQTHISIATPNEEIRAMLQGLSETGLLVHISELDVRINPEKINNLQFTQKLYNDQGMKLKAVAKLYKTLVPSNQQHGITFWDISDGDSWIVVQMKRHDAPCLFDEYFNKKLAFYGFLQGLK